MYEELYEFYKDLFKDLEILRLQLKEVEADLQTMREELTKSPRPPAES